MSKTPLVLIEPDGFIGTATTVAGYIPQFGQSDTKTILKQAEYASGRGWDLDDITRVSRPLSGMSIKPNTHAFVQVLKEDGTPIFLFNQLGKGLGKTEESDMSMGGMYKTGSGKTYKEQKTQQTLSDIIPGAGGGSVKLEEQGLSLDVPSLSFGAAESEDDKPGRPNEPPNMAAWTDWILQSVREQRVEKTQVVETFGDTYFYAFGERPRALAFQGLLLNSLDYAWRSIFWENWDRYFRATKLIEAGARMYIGWDDILVEGYPINAAAAETADSPNAMTFQFTFYVTNYINTSAQSGFLSQKQARIARIRGGYQGGPGSSGRVDELAGLFRETHFIDFIGPWGANTVGGKVEAGMRKATGLIADRGEGGLQNAFANWTGSSLSSLLDGVGKGLMSLALSPAIGAAFTTNWYRQFTYNTLKFWKNIAVGQLEYDKGFAHGEVNAWFGTLSTVVERLLVGKGGKGAGDGGQGAGELLHGQRDVNSSTNNPNWIGAPAGFAGDAVDALVSGSLDRLIGALAFNIPAIGDTTAISGNPYAEAEPGAATLVQMRALEDVPNYGGEGLGSYAQVGSLGAAVPGGGHVMDSQNTWGTFESGSFDAGSSPITDF